MRKFVDFRVHTLFVFLISKKLRFRKYENINIGIRNTVQFTKSLTILLHTRHCIIIFPNIFLIPVVPHDRSTRRWTVYQRTQAPWRSFWEIRNARTQSCTGMPPHKASALHWLRCATHRTTIPIFDQSALFWNTCSQNKNHISKVDFVVPSEGTPVPVEASEHTALENITNAVVKRKCQFLKAGRASRWVTVWVRSAWFNCGYEDMFPAAVGRWCVSLHV